MLESNHIVVSEDNSVSVSMVPVLRTVWQLCTSELQLQLLSPASMEVHMALRCCGADTGAFVECSDLSPSVRRLQAVCVCQQLEHALACTTDALVML